MGVELGLELGRNGSERETGKECEWEWNCVGVDVVS